MQNLIGIPVVTADFDGQTAALDAAIRDAAADFEFSYLATAPTFDQIYHVPDLVYKLIQHYTMRGFICTYSGEAGTLHIAWDYPNISWLEQREVTRSIPDMIPNLGIAFRAGLIYLCMTNGNDLRVESDLTLQTKLGKEIKAAATLGNHELTFGFPSVPAPVVQNLFSATFDLLSVAGFEITYNANTNLFILRWGETIPVIISTGSSLSVALS